MLVKHFNESSVIISLERSKDVMLTKHFNEFIRYNFIITKI